MNLYGLGPGLGPAEKPGRVRSGPDVPEFNLELHWGVVKGADSAATYRTRDVTPFRPFDALLLRRKSKKRTQTGKRS